MAVRFEVSPCTVTDRMVVLIGEICEKVGECRGNFGPAKDGLAQESEPFPASVQELLAEYQKLTGVKSASLRSSNHHDCPMAVKVPGLLEALLNWVNTTDVHPLIRFAVFHYEFRFIVPFEKNNGAMGWQLFGQGLSDWRPAFATLSAENMEKRTRLEIGRKFAQSVEYKNAAFYVEWLLKELLNEIREAPAKPETEQEPAVGRADEGQELPPETAAEEIAAEAEEEPAVKETEGFRERGTGKTGRTNGMTQDERNARFMEALGEETLTAKELMSRLGINHPPTFRSNYLHPVLEAGLVERTIPDKPNSSNQKYRKTRKNLPTGFIKLFALDE